MLANLLSVVANVITKKNEVFVTRVCVCVSEREKRRRNIIEGSIEFVVQIICAIM